MVHKQRICEKSQFLKAACNPHWESGKTNTITLEDEDPVFFSLFLAWHFTGRLRNAAEFVELAIEDEERFDETREIWISVWRDSAEAQFLQLCKSFILEEFLQANKFCDHIMSVMTDLTEHYYCKDSKFVPGMSDQVREVIWAGTAPDWYDEACCSSSPLRRFLLDLHIEAVDGPYASSDGPLTQALGDFWSDLARQSLKALQNLNRGVILHSQTGKGTPLTRYALLPWVRRSDIRGLRITKHRYHTSWDPKTSME